jgi:DNA-binding NtrC family response regulator
MTAMAGERESILECRERLMVVDDEVIVMDLFSLLLRHWGYHVSSFSDSREALDVFLSNPDAFDLVVTDATMPYLNGTDLAARIHSLRPRLPIILCSGNSENEVQQQNAAARAGITTILQKPMSNDALGEAVRKALASQNCLCESVRIG